MGEDNYTGHVVVLPYPSQGHINPLLQFGKRLASKGVKVTLATTVYTVKSICAENVTVEPISDGFDEGGFAQAKNEDLYLKSFKANGSETLSKLIQKFQKSGPPVNCVVYDAFLPWALDVAKQYGIFGAAFFTYSTAVCNVYYRIYSGLLSLPVKPEDTPLVIHGLPPLNFNDLPTYLKFPESYPAYLAMQLNQYSNLDEADFVFGNTFEELYGKEGRDIPELWKGESIGPVVPSSYLDGRIEGDRGYGASLWKPLSEECLEWLESKPPKSVVYVSFGSMVSLTEEQMEELAWALKESNLHFLWVVRESQYDKLPALFVDSINEKGLVVPWCNQLEILAHQATGCFLTHCGWNSTLEALSLGIPMVSMPQWADQMTNAKYVEEIWKVGVRATEDKEGVVRKEEVLKCLQEVMDGKRSQEIKNNARKWRQLAKEAISEGGSSDDCINDFVEHLMFANQKKSGTKDRNGLVKHLNGYSYAEGGKYRG